MIPDHNADVFLPPVEEVKYNCFDKMVHFVFDGFKRWDAVYFTHISEFGYTYENCIAFFPLFPILVYLFANIFSCVGIINFNSWILVSSIFVNNVIFILTALLFFQFGKRELKNSPVAYYAAVLFCFNPASIFMSAPYSETLYFFFLILALSALRDNAFYAASFLIALSVLCRSNGLVGIGFVLHAIGCDFIKNVTELNSSHKRVSQLQKLISYVMCLNKTILKAILCFIISSFSFFAYQFYIFKLFCTPFNKYVPEHLLHYGRYRGYKIVGDLPSSWCNNSLPFSYSYIQNHHWGVGLLKYYEFKQIPNFILALPVILLVLKSCWHIGKANKKYFWHLGLGNNCLSVEYVLRDDVKTLSDDEDDVHENADNNNSNIKKLTINECNPQLIVHVIHLLALTLFGCLFVHIQVSFFWKIYIYLYILIVEITRKKIFFSIIANKLD